MMKSVMLLLLFVAACACQGEAIDEAVQSAPDDSVPIASEYSSPSYVDGSYGAYGSGYEARGAYDGRDGRREARYTNEGIRDEGYRGGNINEGVFNEYIYDGKDYNMFFVPRLIGRQGLGFQKRNYYSGGMRFPITPQILEPIGYRPTVKEIYYEPLPKYNYN